MQVFPEESILELLLVGLGLEAMSSLLQCLLCLLAAIDSSFVCYCHIIASAPDCGSVVVGTADQAGYCFCYGRLCTDLCCHLDFLLCLCCYFCFPFDTSCCIDVDHQPSYYLDNLNSGTLDSFPSLGCSSYFEPCRN